MTKITHCYADVAELADALVLGTSANGVEVRVLSSAPMTYLFELIKQIDTKINQKINLVDFFVALIKMKKVKLDSDVAKLFKYETNNLHY